MKEGVKSCRVKMIFQYEDKSPGLHIGILFRDGTFQTMNLQEDGTDLNLNGKAKPLKGTHK